MLVRRVTAGLSLTVIGAALAACASTSSPAPRQGGGTVSSSSEDVPSRVPVPASTSAPAAECGSVPGSIGPLTHVARLTLSVPATAMAGDTVAASATVTSNALPPRVIAMPAASALLVVHEGVVVGVTRGTSTPATPEMPLLLSGTGSHPAQALPRQVRLEACGSGAAATALPAGQYSVVAVLGYRVDGFNAAPAGGAPDTGAGVPLNTGPTFALVSAPAPLTVS